MKKEILGLIVVGIFTVMSCGSGESETTEAPKEEVSTEVAAEETTNVTDAGKTLFTEKACVACHQEAAKVVGPSLQTIAEAYTDNKAGIVSFLKEESEAIVDPEQYAVMQANLAVTKEMSDEDLNAIADYILSNKQ